MPFSYAMQAHSGTTASAMFLALIFAGNGVAYAVAAIVFGILAARPSGAAIRDTLWPSEPERCTLVIAFAAPFAFAIPGMGVSVEIKTGRRRAIDYLLSPLREITSRAGSER
jgi:hypothetical protein